MSSRFDFPLSDPIVEAFRTWVNDRVRQMADEEIERARERLKERIPELAAEIAIRLQSALNPQNLDTTIQILIRPKI